MGITSYPTTSPNVSKVIEAVSSKNGINVGDELMLLSDGKVVNKSLPTTNITENGVASSGSPTQVRVVRLPGLIVSTYRNSESSTLYYAVIEVDANGNATDTLNSGYLSSIFTTTTTTASEYVLRKVNDTHIALIFSSASTNPGTIYTSLLEVNPSTGVMSKIDGYDAVSTDVEYTTYGTYQDPIDPTKIMFSWIDNSTQYLYYRLVDYSSNPIVMSPIYTTTNTITQPYYSGGGALGCVTRISESATSNYMLPSDVSGDCRLLFVDLVALTVVETAETMTPNSGLNPNSWWSSTYLGDDQFVLTYYQYGTNYPTSPTAYIGKYLTTNGADACTFGDPIGKPAGLPSTLYYVTSAYFIEEAVVLFTNEQLTNYVSGMITFDLDYNSTTGDYSFSEDKFKYAVLDPVADGLFGICVDIDSKSATTCMCPSYKDAVIDDVGMFSQSFPYYFLIERSIIDDSWGVAITSGDCGDIIEHSITKPAISGFLGLEPLTQIGNFVSVSETEVVVTNKTIKFPYHFCANSIDFETSLGPQTSTSSDLRYSYSSSYSNGSEWEDSACISIGPGVLRGIGCKANKIDCVFEVDGVVIGNFDIYGTTNWQYFVFNKPITILESMKIYYRTYSDVTLIFDYTDGVELW